jgi:tRNA(His) 5'-end guanylyltransferase
MDTLGDRLKQVEQVEAGRKGSNQLPLLARLDGKAFHTFTRGLKRPYDERLTKLMIDTTKYLVEKFNARLGYTQSDEISLYWYNLPDSEAEYIFNCKYQKITSVLAGTASAFFTKNLSSYIPEKADNIAIFDCRAWNVDCVEDVYYNFLWRQDDAIKNSISMAAQAVFSHKQLDGIGSEEKKSWLRAQGKPWEDMPEFFKMGSWVKRVAEKRLLTLEELEKIPEKYRPTEPVIRTSTLVFYPGYIKNNKEVRDIEFPISSNHFDDQ